MEKVKLTSEQAAEIEAMKDLGYSLNDWHKMKEESPNSVAFQITLEEFAKAYLIGYEVKETFKSGDKVFVDWLDGGRVHQVGTVRKDGQVILQRDFALNCMPNMHNVRHATQEEIYWLETLDREKIGDFREGDVLKQEGQFLQVFENMGCDVYGSHVSPEFAAKLYSGGLLYALSTAESFKPLPKKVNE